MALLTPNSTYTVNGVMVREKIIPDGTRWQDAAKAKAAGFSAGAFYKSGKLLCGTGRAKSVTIHNTADLANVYDDGEQYTRATYSENMGSTRVHFYADDTGAWQNLRAGTGMVPVDPIGKAEVGWHSGDGSAADGGNMTSLAIEIIMGESAASDEKAKDNGTRLAAWLLWRNGLAIGDLVSHTHWVAKAAGRCKADVDEQCTTLISGKKWCPAYIFGSTSHAAALKNWKAFKALVQKYMAQLDGGSSAAVQNPDTGAPAKVIAVGSTVTTNDGAVYGGLTSTRGKQIPGYITGGSRYTIKRLATNRGVAEALLAEINSWGTVSSLTFV